MRDVNLSMFALLLVVSIATFLWASRREWQRKQCPSCRYYIPAKATHCWSCHRRYREGQK